MKLQFRKLPVLIVATVFAVTATTTMARTFRSADVHPLDYPTVLAVGYMGKLISERSAYMRTER